MSQDPRISNSNMMLYNYYLIIAPRATVPFAVVFWVGVVVMVGGAAGGATGVVMSMVPLKTAGHPRDSGGSPFS